MSNVIYFPLNIRYHIAGVNRDGRLIVRILNTPEQFMMRVEHILANANLSRQFPKRQVSWMCEIAQLNRGKKPHKPTVSIF